MSDNPGSSVSGRGRLIALLCDVLREHYVFADRVEAMCRALTDAAAGDDGSDAPSGHALAGLLTARLQAVSPDRHLRVRWFEQAPVDTETSDADELQRRRRAAMVDNHGIHRVERLAGQIGLLDLREFHPAAWAADSLAAAMSLVAPCQALIFDLRRCRGGEPDTVALLGSYLFGERPVHLNSLYVRADDRTREFWTTPTSVAQHLPATPVYVLCSSDTFSAAEEFAYNLQALQRATVVGETTRGGANPGGIHRLDDHFAVFIPDARAINPMTGSNWEGVGVSPDVACASTQALARAHALALEGLLARIAARADPSLDGLREEAESALAALSAAGA